MPGLGIGRPVRNLLSLPAYGRSHRSQTLWLVAQCWDVRPISYFFFLMGPHIQLNGPSFKKEILEIGQSLDAKRFFFSFLASLVPCPLTDWPKRKKESKDCSHYVWHKEMKLRLRQFQFLCLHISGRMTKRKSSFLLLNNL